MYAYSHMHGRTSCILYPVSCRCEFQSSVRQNSNANATNPPSRVGVQHLSVRDIYWMRGLCPTIKSCLCSVFNFTLLGNSVSICTPEQFGGPFFTYIREDDDYDTLCERYAYHCGELYINLSDTDMRVYVYMYMYMYIFLHMYIRKHVCLNVRIRV